jgi:hypothetical protein
MNRLPLVLLAVALAFAFGGCARAPQPALEAPAGAALDTALVLDPLVLSLVSRTTAVRTLRGRAEIEVSAAGWEGSSETEAAVVAERPDHLHLRAYAGPVTAFDLVCDGDRFWADVRDRRELWTGSVQALEHRMGIPALGEKLVMALLGDPFGEPKDARLVSLSADRAVVEWSARGGGVAQARIRRLDGVPLGITWIKDGRTLATVRYDDFVHETDPGLWPRKLTLHWNAPESSLRLAFHELTLNRDLPETAFAPPDPAGAKHVEFGGADSSGEEQR